MGQYNKINEAYKKVAMNEKIGSNLKPFLEEIVEKFGKLSKEFENPNMKKDAESLVKMAQKLMKTMDKVGAIIK